MRALKEFLAIESMDFRKENKRNFHSELKKEEFRMELS